MTNRVRAWPDFMQITAELEILSYRDFRPADLSFSTTKKKTRRSGSNTTCCRSHVP
jgi:hypothetical protein